MAARLRCERLLHAGVAADEDYTWWVCADTEQGQRRDCAFQTLLGTLEMLVTRGAWGSDLPNERRCGPDHATWLFQLRRLEDCAAPLAQTQFSACASTCGQTSHTLMLDRDGCVWSFGAEGVDGRCVKVAETKS